MKKVRNRSRKKKTVQQDGFLFVGPVAAILIVVSGMSISYLHINNRCDQMGQEILSLEKELERAKGQTFVEQKQWEAMIDLNSVTRAVEKHGLNMAWPKSRQVVEIDGVAGSTQYAMNPTRSKWERSVAHE